METRQEIKLKRQQAIERKLELAKQYDTRVVSVKSEDVNICINLLLQTDTAIMRVRKYLGGKVNPDEGLALIKRFEEMVLEIEDITIQACELSDTRYLQNRGTKQIRDRNK